MVTGLLKALVVLGRVVPRSALLAMADGLGSFAFHASGRYRNVAYKNLRMTFGNTLTPVEITQITRDVFRTFAKSFIAEFPWSAGASTEAIRKIVVLKEQDKVTIDRLLGLNRGMIVTTAHFGNFELLGPRFGADGYKISVVVRNDPNSALAEAINDVRRNSYDVIPRGQGAMPFFGPNCYGFVNFFDRVAMLPDQKSDDLLLSFFDIPTGTVAGPAVLALRTGAPILPVYCVRQPDDTHEIVLGEPIIYSTTDDQVADIRAVMTEINRSIELIVRKYPGQWLWLHDRWRNVPELIAREAGEDGMVTA